MKKKLTRRRFVVLAGNLALAVACAGCASVAAAPGTTTACPKGLVNDPYPGRCRLYRDTNNSGYCDLSESNASLVTLP